MKAQENKDSLKVKNLNELIITAPRTTMLLKEMPAAISVVTSNQINTLTKTTAADEVLRLVPGVRVDNGTGSSRVHLYIRGQGILTERGFRGIGVLIDGIAINDPGGYAPDLYDVDWATVKQVEVVRGLAASMYGSGANGGLVNIITDCGSNKPISNTFYASVGSDGFMKTMEQLTGSSDKLSYRVSYSHMQGNGYRIHQAFMGDNFSTKLNWTPSDKIKVTQLISYTKYFNQNSEGINLYRYETFGPRAANVDAIPYNEFQKTQRITGSTIANIKLCENQDLQLKSFFRMNNYRETSNGGDFNRPYINPGFSAQYNATIGKEKLINHISIGADLQSLIMTEHSFGVLLTKADSNRIDTHFGEQSFDTPTVLRNQIIKQRSAGVFFMDKLDISKKLFATLNVRYDYIYNELVDNLYKDSLNLSGTREFSKPTFRFGLAYDACNSANIYANIGTGFLSPTNDELYNNPVKWGGFNMTIEPSTSLGEEFGIRGNIAKKLYYDVTAFSIVSKNEFYRYREAWMGNTSAVYGNIGQSNRTGLETYFSYSPVEPLNIAVAYTYSHFRYTSPDSVKDHWIPQCPAHQLAAEVSYKFLKNFEITLSTQYLSKWCIQVDDSLYDNYTILETAYQPQSVRSSWVDGYNIFSANLAYEWKLGKLNGNISLFVKNITDVHYFGFTEPNNGPDYNSYQAAPGREIFCSLKVKF